MGLDWTAPGVASSVTMKTLLFLVLLASRAYADDPSAVMAALRDEKSECRYLTSLCTEVVVLGKAAVQGTGNPTFAMAKLNALMKAANVLGSKHDKTPACLKECNDRLGVAGEH